MKIVIYRGDKYALTARLLTETRIEGGSVTFAINSDRHELLFERTVDALLVGADLAAIDLAGMDTAGIPHGFHFLSIRYWQDGPDAITLAAGVPVEVRRGYPHAPGSVVAGGLGEQGAVLFVMPPDATGANQSVLNIETQGAAIPALTRSEVAEFQAALDAGLVTEALVDGAHYVRKDGVWVLLPEYPAAVQEAPIDTTPYVRQDASWVVLPPYPDVPVQESPIDGSPYVRQDGAWLALPEYPDVPVQEAPIDTTPYVRQDASWLSLPMPAHNDLGGLNSGDYRHLTADEYTTLAKVGEDGLGDPTWNGDPWPGGGGDSLWTQGTGAIYPTTLANRVGIGVTNPDRELHIKGPNTWVRLDRDNAQYGPAILFVRGDAFGAIQSTWIFGPTNISGSLNNDFAITDYGVATAGGTTGDVRISIRKSDGNVGISRLDPNARLHVKGPGNTSAEADNILKLENSAEDVLTVRGDGITVRHTLPPEYADDTAAEAGGLPIGGEYRTGSALNVRHGEGGKYPTDALGTLTSGATITLDIAGHGATTATIPDAATITLAATGWPAVGFSEAHTLILTMLGSATVQIPVEWVPQGGDLTFDASGSTTIVVYSPDGGANIYYIGGQ